MTNQLKEYIENNIEYLDEKNYYFFILNSITELNNPNLNTLINILYEIEDDEALIDTARENVLRFYITMQIEEYADDEDAPNSYSISQFCIRYLGVFIGYTLKEIVDFILDNQAEWADNMIEKNSQWRICK